MNPLLNRIVRGYLRASPVTEGKGWLLRRTESRILPDEAHVLAETKHGFALHLNLANPEHRRIYFYGEHDERYEIALLGRLIRPGDACWDIGANIGFYTCLLARIAGPDGRVDAFEPATATRALLERNVAANDFGNVTVHAQALGAAPGTASIHFRSRDLAEGTASLIPAGDSAESEPVTVTTLDALAGTLPDPDFVKIDVEGLQLDVWRGGAQFFASHAPLVLAELRETSDRAHLAALDACIAGHGYRLFEIRKRGIRRAPSLVAARGRNFLLAKPGSAGHERLGPLPDG